MKGVKYVTPTLLLPQFCRFACVPSGAKPAVSVMVLSPLLKQLCAGGCGKFEADDNRRNAVHFTSSDMMAEREREITLENEKAARRGKKGSAQPAGPPSDAAPPAAAAAADDEAAAAVEDVGAGPAGV